MRKFACLLAAFLWLALWPGAVQSQSAALMDAFRQFSDLYAQGRYQEALPFAEKALVFSKEEFGAEHPNTAIMLNNLAELYRAQGKYAEAEPLYPRRIGPAAFVSERHRYSVICSIFAVLSILVTVGSAHASPPAPTSGPSPT